MTSKVYRRVALYDPGEYIATLNYYNGTKTVANWIVRPLQQQKRAKNVILFIGDGMTTNMITAGRLIAHKSINGKYQSTMQMDKFPVLGHQMVSGSPLLLIQAADISRPTLSIATSPTLRIVLQLFIQVIRVRSMQWVSMPTQGELFDTAKIIY